MTLVGFGLSFLPFTSLANSVFSMGWLGIVFVAVLLGTWLVGTRSDISEESTRRERVRRLVLYRLDRQRQPGHSAAAGYLQTRASVRVHGGYLRPGTRTSGSALDRGRLLGSFDLVLGHLPVEGELAGLAFALEPDADLRPMRDLAVEDPL